MVRVAVRPLGPWQMILGGETMDIEFSGRTLRDLLDVLDKKSLGMLKKEFLDEEGAINPGFRIYVNGVSCDDRCLDIQISDGDNIMLFSVIDGG